MYDGCFGVRTVAGVIQIADNGNVYQVAGDGATPAIRIPASALKREECRAALRLGAHALADSYIAAGLQAAEIAKRLLDDMEEALLWLQGKKPADDQGSGGLPPHLSVDLSQVDVGLSA